MSAVPEEMIAAPTEAPLLPQEEAKEGQLQAYSGAWTMEEKHYATALIEEFRDGNIPGLADKTTMRGYLAEKLKCPTKRISKKYEGTGYNGRLPYTNGAVLLDPHMALARQQKLVELEANFKKSRAALLESRDALPAKKVAKQGPLPKPKKKSYSPAGVTNAPPDMTTVLAAGRAAAGMPPPSGSMGDSYLAAASMNRMAYNPDRMFQMNMNSQDMMLDAMIRERRRMAALEAAGMGVPSSTDWLMARRAALLDPLHNPYAGAAGASSASLLGSGLQMNPLGNQFGGVYFPSMGMGRSGLGGQFGAASLPSSFGLYGATPAASAGLTSTSTAGSSLQEDMLADVLRRKRELMASSGMGEQTLTAAAVANISSETAAQAIKDPEPPAKKAKSS